MPRKTDAKLSPFRVGRSRSGLGLFAVAPIRKGAFIVEYWGKLIPAKVADTLATRYLFDLNSRWTIDGSDRRNIARYINHSCRPNAVPRGGRKAIRIYAKRNIKPGEEIAYNYGKDYFNKLLKPVGCKCVACVAPPDGRKRKLSARKTAAGDKARSQ